MPWEYLQPARSGKAWSFRESMENKRNFPAGPGLADTNFLIGEAISVGFLEF